MGERGHGEVPDVFAVSCLGGRGVGSVDVDDDGDLVSHVVGEVNRIADCDFDVVRCVLDVGFRACLEGSCRGVMRG